MKSIKDSIHGVINVSGSYVELLDCPGMQRLRRVKQLGTTNLVYPSAHHTRFEHSLGAYHLANKVTEVLEADEENKEYLKTAALLHDVGHPPFSHGVERLMNKKLENGFHHENIHNTLTQHQQLRNTLKKQNKDLSKIEKFVKGETNSVLSNLLTNSINLDRMDYLARDAHHTGASFGAGVDYERLIDSLKIVDNKIVLEETSIKEAETLLFARAQMYATVYQHHGARISEEMLNKAIEAYLNNTNLAGKQNPEPILTLKNLEDRELLNELEKTSRSKVLINNILNRNLYKRVKWSRKHEVPNEILNASYLGIKRLERKIATDADINHKQVIVDIPKKPKEPEKNMYVLINGEPTNLSKVSDIPQAVHSNMKSSWRAGVYTSKKHVDKVDKVLKKMYPEW